MGSHSTQVPNSSPKLHSIHSIVLVHNAMYMAHTNLRLVFNFSSFPPWPMKIEVWPVFKLKISTGLHHYLDTIQRTVVRVIATNFGLKTSNDLALVSRGRSINVSRHKISSYSILVISLQLIIGCKSVNYRLVIIGTMLGCRTVVYLFTESKDM